jgi:hypothetical protein
VAALLIERETAKPAARAARVRDARWWLIARLEGGRIEWLTVGQETLPVFGFPEEAELFLRLGGLGDGWRARESRPGELTSVLAGPCRGVGRVALDPTPAMLRDGTMPLVSVDRGRFLRRFLGHSMGRPLGAAGGSAA